MNNYPDILKSLVLRAIIALPFFVIGVSGAASVFSPFSIIVGALILAWPLAALIAEPCSNLFYSRQPLTGPQPMYSIPQSKRASGLYEEAMAGFEDISEDHPTELKPYVEMIDIAIVNLQDPDRANEIYQRGIASIKSDDNRDALATMYSAIRTRLKTTPSN